MALVNRPEYVRVAQPVHQLHLSQHVGPVAAHLVHLQSHDLVRGPVTYLRSRGHPSINTMGGATSRATQSRLLARAAVKTEAAETGSERRMETGSERRTETGSAMT